MVDADQAARRATRTLREIGHGVGVGAELAFLRVDGVGIQPVVRGEAARVEILRAGYETVTPASHDVVAIAIGDRERIVVLRRDAGERGRGGAAGALRRNVRTGGESNGRGGAGDDGAARQARREDGIKGGSFHGRAC